MNHIKRIKTKIRKTFIISCIVFLLIQMLSFVTPYIMGRIIDYDIPNKNTVNIIIGISAFILVPLTSTLLQVIYNYYCITYSRKTGNKIAITIMKNLVYKENQYFDKINSLELLTYSSKEAVNYVHFYVSDLAKYYILRIVAIALIIVLTIYNPILGLMQVLFIPISYFPVKKMTKSIEASANQIVENNAKMDQIKGDVFKAIGFIKSMRLEEKKINEVDRKIKQTAKIWGKVAVIDTLSGMWTSGFITAMFMGLTFGLGALFCVLDIPYIGLSIGKLVSIITYCGIFYANIHQILNATINRKKREGEYEKLFSYIELKGEREANRAKKGFVFNDKIELTNLCFSYIEQNNLVLNDINLIFNKGTWTGIIGPSGSGKSTILDIILKMYPVDNDMVRIDGIDINEISSFSLRDEITKISQDIYLFPGTIKDNLLLVNKKVTNADIKNALEFACLDEYISSLPQGILTDIGEVGKLMSGGEKQRLSIAMGILRGKKILLLDEVTAHLNVDLEDQLCENFNKLISQGYTIISISHHLSFLKYTSKIYEINQGVLSEINS